MRKEKVDLLKLSQQPENLGADADGSSDGAGAILDNLDSDEGIACPDKIVEEPEIERDDISGK